MRNVTVGQSLEGHFPRSMANDEVTITPPESSGDLPLLPQRVATERVDDELRWSFLATTEAGPYVVRRGNESSLEQRFVVNLDTRESDLERLDPTLLPPGLRRAAAGPGENAIDSASTATRHLFRYVLSLLVVLLVSESTLAWWLGQRGALRLCACGARRRRGAGSVGRGAWSLEHRAQSLGTWSMAC